MLSRVRSLNSIVLTPLNVCYEACRRTGLFSRVIVGIGQVFGKDVRRQLLIRLGIITQDALCLLDELEQRFAGYPRLPAISRLTKPTSETFEQGYARVGKPVVLTAVVAESTLQQWSFEALKHQFGELMMSVRRGKDYDTLEKHYLPLGQYLDSMLTGTQDYYMGNNPLPEVMHSLVPLPSKYAGANAFTYERAQLWIGGHSTGAHLHRDLCDNFVLVLNGTKTFYLAAPDESDLLYTWEARPGLSSSKFCAVSPDYERFALAKQAHFIKTTLTQGDLLYIPCGWFHQVVNEGPSCSVNFFGKPLMAIALQEERSLADT